MKERGIPDNAQKLSELLSQHEQWKVETTAFFTATRAATGLTQQAFAEKIGTSQSYVNDIEHGRKTPSSETLKKLRSVTEGESSGDTDQDKK